MASRLYRCTEDRNLLRSVRRIATKAKWTAGRGAESPYVREIRDREIRMEAIMPAKVVTKGEMRVAARMPEEILDRINEAASLLGSTLNQFLVSAALDKANAVLERERVINLNFASARVVLDALANPPEPNQVLKKAMKRRRELLGDPTTHKRS